MMFPAMGRRYQIDYLSGLRYIFSPAYRAQLRKAWGHNTGLRVLYVFGGLVSTVVVILALLFLVLAIQGLLH